MWLGVLDLGCYFDSRVHVHYTKSHVTFPTVLGTYMHTMAGTVWSAVPYIECMVSNLLLCIIGVTVADGMNVN